MSTQVHLRTCTLCEALCGIRIETRGREVLRIQGDPDDPFSKGYICPKAVALQDLQDDPDRLRQPVRRTDSGWEPLDWDEALNYTAQRLLQTREAHGRNSIGAYVGNPNVHNHGNMLFLPGLLKALRTRNRFSATSLDQLPHMLANLQMFGHQGLFPVPDLDRTDLFICWGGNPLASNGSLLTAGGVDRRIKALQKRGGKMITVDPRYTETAALADEHIFIRPGTDALALLAILQTLFSEGWVETGHLQAVLKGLDTLSAAVAPYTPERVEKVCGIPAARLRSLAQRFASTRHAALYGRMGTSVQAYGGLCTWLIHCINLVTAHLDRRGGLMFAQPAVDSVAFGALTGQKGHFDKYRSRIRGLPEFGGELPASVMAEEMLTPGEGQIRAMVTVAGNPVLSSPDGQRLEEALRGLEFMVSVDMYVTETSRHADIILPPTGPLERSHIDIIFPMLAVRNTVKYSPALFEREPDARHDWEILLGLTQRLNGGTLFESLQAEASALALRRLGPDGVADLLLRFGPYGQALPFAERWSPAARRLLERNPFAPGWLRTLWDIGPLGERNQHLPKNLSLARLMESPHGIDLGPLRPCLLERLYTEDGCIQLAPKLYLDDLPRVDALFDRPGDTMLLIGRRHVRSNNSWMHNSHRLVKGPPRCTLLIHPDDASRLGLSEGGKAVVQSRVGEVEVDIEITDAIMPGVVSLPHGWGHHRKGTGQKLAAKHAGVSLNDLTDASEVDPLSGNAVLNAVPVTIRAAGARPRSGSRRKVARSAP